MAELMQSPNPNPDLEIVMTLKPKKGRYLAPTVSSEHAYIGVLRTFLISSPSPAAPSLLGSLRARNFSHLLEWAERVSPTEYGDPSQYYEDAQISLLIRKYPFPAAMLPGLDPEGTALGKFASAEHRCKWVNRKRRALSNRWDPYNQFWEYARSYIRRVIGVKPDLPAVYASCDITAGANVGIHGNATNLVRKILSQDWSVTPTALKYAIPALWSNIQARDAILPGDIKCYDYSAFSDIVVGRAHSLNYNKVGFVPKTAKTYRTIAIEPFLNGYLQKGVDQFMRRRLRRFGIDLSDQRRNQALAREGSLQEPNAYCTLDLAAASDSLSLEVARLLLPLDWFILLDELRSPSYMLNGLVTRYEKFCSMGNGFCFPLQTLIFASVCFAAGKVSSTDAMDFAVYGDDILVRQDRALLVIELLSELGFGLNRSKSFLFGPFRESCGADWYQGQDVRPVTFDKPLLDIRNVMSLHNSFYRSVRTEQRSLDLRSYLRSLSRLKFFRPGREPGDTCFSVPLDAAVESPLVLWDRDLQTWSWEEVVSLPVPDRELYDEAALPYAEWLAVIRGASSEMPATLRYVSRAVRRRVTKPWWNTFDPPWGPSASPAMAKERVAWLLHLHRSSTA